MGFREDLIRSSKERSSRVIVSLDIGGPAETRVERAVRVVEVAGDQLAAVKFHWHLLLPGGLKGLQPLIEVCKSRKIPTIADIKLNDIEATNLEATDLLYGAGVSAIIANPFVGAEEGLSKVVAEAKKTGKGVVLLVYMSHAGAKEGYGLTVAGEPLYREFARRTRDWDVDGAVVSAKSHEIIREVRSILKREQVIMSPGVGVQGGKADREVIDAGTDFVIIGRSVVEAADPRATLRAFNAAMPAP
jgi:orotidine-5'-phosphate decarboxylase